jgi:hypothetical protein
MEEKISEHLAKKLVRVLNEHSLSEKELKELTDICIRVWKENDLIRE